VKQILGLLKFSEHATRTELLTGIYITTDNLQNYYIRKVGGKIAERLSE
jgi:hypothetical protein